MKKAPWGGLRNKGGYVPRESHWALLGKPAVAPGAVWLWPGNDSASTMVHETEHAGRLVPETVKQPWHCPAIIYEILSS